MKKDLQGMKRRELRLSRRYLFVQEMQAKIARLRIAIKEQLAAIEKDKKKIASMTGVITP